MKKIVFVLGSFPLLSETFVLNQLAYLVGSGYDVKIISINHSDSGIDHPWVKKYDLIDKVNYVYNNNNIKHKLVKLAQCATKDMLSGNFKKIILMFKVKPAAYLLDKYLNDDDEIVICHFGPIGSLVANLKGKEVRSRLKIITFFHGADMSVADELNKNLSSYELLFKNGDLMLPISHYWKNKLIELGCNEDKINVHRMGVEVDNFEFKERYVHEGNKIAKINLISVCRFVEKKGLFVLIDALSKLDSRFHLTLVGDGPQREELENYAANHGLNERVNFTGAASSDKVQKLLAAADAFVLPSITASNGDKEGIPVALMEAMASGLMVFSTFHSGIPELINNDVNGFLVPEADPSSLANKIHYVFDNLSDERRQTVVNEARVTIEESFNVSSLNKKLVKTIENILGY